MAAVGHLRDVGLGGNIIFACTIQKPNRHALLEVAHLAAAQGVKKVRFLPLRDEGRATETWSDTGDNLDVAAYEAIFDRFLTGKEKLPQGVEVSCGLNGFTLAQGQDGDCSDQVCTVGSQMYMEPNGNAYPCAIMTEPENRLGNIHEASLHDLVHGEVLARLHDIKLRRKSEISSCAPCQWRNFCQSGCMATARRDKGTFWDTEDLCSYRQKAYTRAFDSILAAGIQPEQPEA
jgi:radical SAM protein with 4Fe4S-binding SPASM domain